MISFPDFVENSLALKVMSTGIVSLIKIGGVIERSNSSRANGNKRVVADVPVPVSGGVVLARNVGHLVDCKITDDLSKFTI